MTMAKPVNTSPKSGNGKGAPMPHAAHVQITPKSATNPATPQPMLPAIFVAAGSIEGGRAPGATGS